MQPQRRFGIDARVDGPASSGGWVIEEAAMADTHNMTVITAENQRKCSVEPLSGDGIDPS